MVQELREKDQSQTELLNEYEEVLEFLELQATSGCNLNDWTGALFFLFKLGVPQIYHQLPSKLLCYGRWSWVAFTPVNHIIMSTPSIIN